MEKDLFRLTEQMFYQNNDIIFIVLYLQLSSTVTYYVLLTYIEMIIFIYFILTFFTQVKVRVSCFNLGRNR